MPHFTLQIQPGGPIVTAYVTVSEPRLAALVAAKLPMPPPVPIRALVDTGASITCVDSAVLAKLQLTPTGTTRIMTPSTGVTPQTTSLFDVGLVIPPAMPHHARHLVPVVAVAEAALASQGIDALIGRDILSECLLTYNGSTGFFTLAF